MKMGLFYFAIKAVLVLGMMITMANAESIVSSDEALHATAHVGASYLITHASQVICTKITGKEHKLGCTIAGAVIAATAGTLKEVVIDRGESKKQHALGYTEDAIGISAAITIISIDW